MRSSKSMCSRTGSGTSVSPALVGCVGGRGHAEQLVALARPSDEVGLQLQDD